MGTKSCKKCGWVVAERDMIGNCPVCGTSFGEGMCRVCGEFKPFYSNQGHVCAECYLRVVKKPDTYMNMLNRRRDMFKDWVKRIKQIPADCPTLTEEQWMEAVKYFGGCALCDSESIDARGYFIPFEHGGRYCNWNILPVCEKCATRTRTVPNYFLWNRPKNLDKIVDYLEERINAAYTKTE